MTADIPVLPGAPENPGPAGTSGSIAAEGLRTPATGASIEPVPAIDGETGRRTPSIVLVGPPGAGKSTIGRKLARELDQDLYDTDAGIEERAGRTIPEIFAQDGEPEFRRMEEEVVRDAILAGHGVISLGGGSVLSAATRQLLRDHTVVYLEISVGEGLRRTGASTNRPLLNGDDPAEKYRELMKIRRPLYREVATVRVRTDGRSPGRVVRMILAKLGLEPQARPEEPATPETPVPSESGSGRTRSRRRRRRGGRGRGENRTATASSAAETTAATEPAPGDSAHDLPSVPDSASGTSKSTRRHRRSRRRGRRPADTATPATGDTHESPSATPSSSGTPGRGSARRRASRSAGAPNTVPPNTGAPDTAAPAVAQPSTTSADEAPPQQDSDRSTATARTAPGEPGRAAAPGAGRSRRARARRARARQRAQAAGRSDAANRTAEPGAAEVNS